MEREQEFTVLEHAFTDAVNDGVGSTIVIEAPAGGGKSRLLAVAGDKARETGMLILGASASELEQDFPFGVAIQLFEPRWASTDFAERQAWAKGPARAAAELLDGQLAERPFSDQGFPLIHGLYWLATKLASAEPLVMLIDDVHWADRPTLRFLVYPAERTARLPLVVIVTVRRGELVEDEKLLNSLTSSSTAAILSPRPLTALGITTLVKAEFAEARDVFVNACAQVTGGNPLLLGELLAQLRADGRPPDETTQPNG